MEERLFLKGKEYTVPAVFCRPAGAEPCPALILCHGTGSHKDEVGGMFRLLACRLAELGIASIRMDFAGCGESPVPGEALTFLGEVADTALCFDYLKDHPAVDAGRIGILGFSQGARVMAEFLRSRPALRCAVSWSGACHNGPGLFADWFESYYKEAQANGFARIPMGWREDLHVSLGWFDQLAATCPMEGFTLFDGPVLAFAGREDTTVPCSHTGEIIALCHHEKSRAVFIDGADHTFNVLTADPAPALQVVEKTALWLAEQL